jgi:septal ring factor EnvC (AmiA/AmiB activator)
MTVAAATAICVSLLAGGSAAASVDSLEGKSADAAARVQQLSSQLTSDRAGFDQASERAAAAGAREAELSGQISTGAARVDELQAQLQTESDRLDQARERLRRAERLLASRLADIYMAGIPDTTDIVLGSADFADLATQAEYVNSIRSADQRLAERVRAVRETLAASVERIGSLKGEAEAQVAALDAARSQVAAVRAEAEAGAARLASISASRQSEIDQLKGDIEQWQRRIERQEEVTPVEAEQQVSAELGGPYAIPTYIVMCESGGNYAALNPSSGAGGAYQIMPETWAAYGGTGLPNEAPKAEQDRIAGLIYADSGTAPWVCG